MGGSTDRIAISQADSANLCWTKPRSSEVSVTLSLVTARGRHVGLDLDMKEFVRHGSLQEFQPARGRRVQLSSASRVTTHEPRRRPRTPDVRISWLIAAGALDRGLPLASMAPCQIPRR